MPGASEPSDEGLVAEVVRGSESALARLYDRHHRRVFVVAVAVTGDPHVAEEVVQDVYLALWNRAETFDPSRSTVSTWLVAIARNRSLDRRRASSRRIRALEMSALHDPGPDDSAIDRAVDAGQPLAASVPPDEPEVAVELAEASSSLAVGIRELPHAEQAVIVLAYRDGLTQSEIAARLRWPLGTVKTRTRRAIVRLRTILETGPRVELGSPPG